MGYLLAILTLAALCALWAGFQLWLNKADPVRAEDYGTHCSSCPRACDQAQRPANDSKGDFADSP